MRKLKPISEQVVVITGATSGIGLVTACSAARRGAKVMLVARNAAVLKAVAEQIESDGGEAAYWVADVGELSQVQAAAEATVARFGRIDSWVSNAGVAIYADLLTTPREEHERLFRTNYWGAVNSAQVAIPYLRNARGAFIMIGSIASDMGSPVMGAYVASKHAVKGYIDSLRIELNRDAVPVSVTLVKPSGIGTPLAQHVANHKQGGAKIPPPVYAPETVAAAILHAAQHPVREVTVGGVGVAQVLIAAHFPGLFSKIGGAVTPLLNDPKTPAAMTDNLFSPSLGGHIHGPNAAGRPFSLYTLGRLHPVAAITSGVAAAVLAALALKHRVSNKRLDR